MPDQLEEKKRNYKYQSSRAHSTPLVFQVSNITFRERWCLIARCRGRRHSWTIALRHVLVKCQLIALSHVLVKCRPGWWQPWTTVISHVLAECLLHVYFKFLLVHFWGGSIGPMQKAINQFWAMREVSFTRLDCDHRKFSKCSKKLINIPSFSEEMLSALSLFSTFYYFSSTTGNLRI